MDDYEVVAQELSVASLAPTRMVRGDDPELAESLWIEERELEAGELN